MNRSVHSTSFDARTSLEEEAPGDEELVRRIVAGEASLFATLMRRYNQRLFRVVRSIVRSPCEAEDVLQQAYLSAYVNLAQFEGRSRFSTWLTRIAVHEALGRVRLRARRELPLEAEATSDGGERDPEQQASERELARLFEEACDSLPDIYRSVFVMRGIEEMSIAETAACLDLSEEAIKVRYHRARALLRARVDDQVGEAAREAYSFLGARCAGMVARVSSHFGWAPVPSSSAG
jgi:RNA polymerase sigma-70 factor (ECF subfamily)